MYSIHVPVKQTTQPRYKLKDTMQLLQAFTDLRHLGALHEVIIFPNHLRWNPQPWLWLGPSNAKAPFAEHRSFPSFS